MGLFTKKIGTFFQKETSDTDFFLEKMEELKGKAEGGLRQEIEKQIKIYFKRIQKNSKNQLTPRLTCVMLSKRDEFTVFF